MENGRTVLTEAVRKVQLLKIDGYCATAAMEYSDCIKSKWNIDGHEWEVHFYPNWSERHYSSRAHLVVVKLILLGEPRWNKLNVNLSCRLVDPSGHLDPGAEKSVSYLYTSRYKCCCTLFLMNRDDVPSSGYLVNDSLTVQCTITVLKELSDIVVPAYTEALPLQVPPSDLGRHFGELWQGQRGADVTFVLDSGERFLAHKIILAARSPVFMAEFFGGMNERNSQSVRIEGMDAEVFKVMLHFIYTDTAPELDEETEVAVTMAQHLLAAADRYGLDGLKLMCETKLAGGISIDTVATTLALAEQHNCLLLKTKCVDFIARSPETLDAAFPDRADLHPGLRGCSPGRDQEYMNTHLYFFPRQPVEMKTMALKAQPHSTGQATKAQHIPPKSEVPTSAPSCFRVSAVVSQLRS